ncbi:hypothetical protein swp_0528 [Shewanella piezotolerans WP3]|uniref:Uncharacterized protein n=1 Tax=Shewanella piezotolerans (strain WP3 / JCM 13877) TaxID=225849 RepID=B8CI81_SHEPW|nr:hypothetical protein swp_0528 [Shewanella piezotolerans WP3]
MLVIDDFLGNLKEISQVSNKKAVEIAKHAPSPAT